MKLALVLIVKPSDEEAVLLERCLTNVAPHVDGIFLTITGENKACEEVGKKFHAKVSHFEWCNDFSAARNFNFHQVPKEYDYIFWLDCDDMVRGLPKLKATMQEHPADAYAMMYLYWFDEFKNPIVVHQKTRVLKNDGCVEWAGALHEDFKENRAVGRYLIEGIEVLHLSSEERVQAAKKRNVEVAVADMGRHPDDPRSYWNLGNSLKADGQGEEAIKVFEKFQTLSASEDEKYIVNLRLAESYMGLGKPTEALDKAATAIGLRPTWPDAFHLKGHILFQQKRFAEARDSYLQGLTLKPPYHSIIVYNPRDYDYVPLMALAKCYFNLSLPTQALECLRGCKKIQPKNQEIDELIKVFEVQSEEFEKVIRVVSKLLKLKDKKLLKRRIEKLSPDIRQHPAICNLWNNSFVKTESSGKDLVFYCGLTSEEWTPETAIAKGIGGSEEAVINLSKELVKQGWNVTVYNNCGHKELEFEGVKYKPFWAFNYRDKQDVVIAWRSAKILDYEVNSPKVYLDIHDVIGKGEFTEARMAKCSGVFFKSKAHRELYPSVPNDKAFIVPNGIHWDQFQNDTEKDPNLIINTSSPDRSLSALIECFRRIKQKCPEAKCQWAYGWRVYDAVHKNDPRMMAWKLEMQAKMKEVGIEELGRLGHDEIAKLYQKATVFLYPTEFFEIDCISARKSLAGGCWPVTTDFAALNETVKFGEKIHSKKTAEDWCKPGQYDYAATDLVEPLAEATIKVLKMKKDTTAMRAWTGQFDWEEVANKWNNILK